MPTAAAAAAEEAMRGGGGEGGGGGAGGVIGVEERHTRCQVGSIGAAACSRRVHQGCCDGPCAICVAVADSGEEI